MPNLTLERSFAAPIEKVFDFVSKTEHLLKWWGPETVQVTEHALAMDKPGPWMSVMTNDAGGRFKVSGQVTHVDPPNSIGFTWAWHDEADQRGVESHVTIRLVPAQNGGTHFTLSHVDLPDEEAAQNHNQGWTSSLRKLQAMSDA
ncbi:putative glutathione S-transferase-related transmembrane protein [Candidatus Rhodobacter oscarellae]|uniref:Putative glutathione S-transferase-related transmembrane protein n=1 Tax=Candidatus Rhodobacter oscarellae TaxID=1675527 RepID=A0A0J9EDB7_9RHOB|nr:SRPBCC domain-containing protein [Candidatus Rhodobacter lobularis]KMW59719.1 putative glutathione S-transferase-related transmembrane protein [Candidatus Rhodobacter lobularis]